MICPSAIGLDRVAIDQLLTMSTPSGRSRVLGIAGYPYTGKSHLARAVQAAWPSGDATILPTESVVLPRTMRQSLSVDGCSTEGHDMRALHHLTASLCNGKSVVCNKYSWLAAGPVGTILLDGVRQNDLLILDGTVAAAPSIIEQCDLLIFLSPIDSTSWLRLACERDVTTRGWEANPARLANTQKSKTSSLLRDTAEESLGISALVDPSSWTWFLPECGLCVHLPRNLIAKATVTVPICKAR